MTEAVTQLEIDQRVFDLYDEYCHGRIDRREFLRLSALVAGGLAMAQALLPRYAQAQTISFTDTRIKARYVTYPSPGGNSGEMRGYLVQPAGSGPFPAVLVIHENRGLNPYIEDVARRAAVEGFVALAPDGLFPVGGYPGNDDDGRTLQGNLDQAKLRTDMLNSATVLKGHKLSTGKLGVTGFCWGGSIVNYLAVSLGSDLHAGAPDRRGATPDAHIPGHPARLPQQLDAALPRSVGETGVGSHHRLLQEKPGRIGRPTTSETTHGKRQHGHGTSASVHGEEGRHPRALARQHRHP